MSRRKTLFVDAVIQGSLLKRMLIHWTIYLVTMFLLLGMFHYFRSLYSPGIEGFGDYFLANWLSFAVILALVPVFLVDTLRFSSRFAGPFARLRESLEMLAEGQNVEPLQVRHGDFLSDFSVYFNRVVERIRRAELDSTASFEDAARTTTDYDELEPVVKA